MLQDLTEPPCLSSHSFLPVEEDTFGSVNSPCTPVSGEAGVQAQSVGLPTHVPIHDYNF